MTDPKPQYGYLVKEIRDRHPDFSYIHVIKDYDPVNSAASASNDSIRQIWGNRPLISAGGYGEDPERGIRVAKKRGDIIAYSRAFIANVGIFLSCMIQFELALIIVLPSPIFLAAGAMVSRWRWAMAQNITHTAPVTRLVTPITRFTSPASTGR
jgi:hypothetical protein